MIRNWLSRNNESRTPVAIPIDDANWAACASYTCDAGDGDFFRALVETLAKSVGVECAWVAELASELAAECLGKPERLLRTLAISLDGGEAESIEYSIADTPARSMFDDTGVRLIRENVQKQYPHDRILREAGATGYADIPLVGSAGQVIGLLAIASRTTLTDNRLLASQLRLCANRAATELERRTADASIRAREARLRLVFEHAPDAVLLLSLDGKLIDANQAAEKLTGLTRAAMIGHNVLLPGIMPEADIRRAANRLHVRAAGAPATQEEFAILHRDGRTLFTETCSELVTIDGERVMLLCLRDITLRKIAEQARQKKADRAYQLQHHALSLATHDSIARRDFQQMARRVTESTCDQLGAVSVSIWLPEAAKRHTRCVDRFESTGRLHASGRIIRWDDARLATLQQTPKIAMVRAIHPQDLHALWEGPGRFVEAGIWTGEGIGGLLRVGHEREDASSWEPEELQFIEVVAKLPGQWLSSRI